MQRMISHATRKERPILFNREMVRAILEGRKTQTRRVVKPQPATRQGMVNASYCGHPNLWLRDGSCSTSDPAREWTCPFGKTGDWLWVRETTVNVEKHGYLGPVYLESDEGRDTLAWGLAPAPDDMTDVEPHEITLRPSIHMPRSMCRIVLEITGVRVERLQTISTEAIQAEGVKLPVSSETGNLLIDMGSDGAGAFLGNGDYSTDSLWRAHWAALWSSVYGRENWEANPWVWVIEFKRVEEGACNA